MKRNMMMMIITLGILFLSTQTVMASPPFIEGDVVSRFIHTLVRDGEKEARSFTVSDVNIPEIRENTPITRVTGLNSPNENVRVSIGYFDSEEYDLERIAFIWEVASKDKKITDIRVVFDGSNPFIDEAKAIQEYQDKMNTPILAASEFPFDITHIDANIDKDTLMLSYRNADLQGSVQIKIVPSDTDLEKIKGENDKYFTLKSGTKALYHLKAPSAHQLIFQHKKLRYSIGISKTTKDSTVEDFLKIANSMLSPQG